MKTGILLGTLALVLGSFAASSDDDEIPAIPAGKLILFGDRASWRLENAEKIKQLRSGELKSWEPEKAEKIVFGEIRHPNTPKSPMVLAHISWSPYRNERSHTLLPNGTILTCGGSYSGGPRYASFASCTAMDTATLTSTDAAPLPEPVSSHEAVAVGDSVFLCGGKAYKADGRLWGNDYCFRYQDGVWKKIAPMAEDRARGFVLVSNGSALVACGGESSLTSKACEFYSIDTDTWTTIQLPESLESKSLSATYGADGRLYIVGAVTHGPPRVLIFHPTSGTWSRGPDASEEYLSPPYTAVNVDGAIWVFGAHTDDNGRILVLERCAQEWRQVQIPSFRATGIKSAFYIPPASLPRNDGVTQTPSSLLPSARATTGHPLPACPSPITPSGELFLYGGYRRLGPRKYEDTMEVWTSDSTNTTTYPLGSDHDRYASYTLFQDRLVMICGGTKEKWNLVGGGGGWISYTPSANCDVMDLATRTSTPSTPLPEPRFYHAAVAFGDSVLLCGGSSDLIQTEESVKIMTDRDDCLRYQNGVWNKMAPMPMARKLFVLVSNGSAVFSCGGLGLPTTCDIYDPAGDTWTSSIQLPVLLKRLSAAFGADGRLYMVGDGPATTPGKIGPARVLIFDPATGSWSQGPGLRKYIWAPYTAVNVDGAIWIFGGRRRGTMTLHVLEPGAQKWRLQLHGDRWPELLSIKTSYIDAAIYRPPLM